MSLVPPGAAGTTSGTGGLGRLALVRRTGGGSRPVAGKAWPWPGGAAGKATGHGFPYIYCAAPVHWQIRHNCRIN